MQKILVTYYCIQRKVSKANMNNCTRQMQCTHQQCLGGLHNASVCLKTMAEHHTYQLRTVGKKVMNTNPSQIRKDGISALREATICRDFGGTISVHHVYFNNISSTAFPNHTSSSGVANTKPFSQQQGFTL